MCPPLYLCPCGPPGTAVPIPSPPPLLSRTHKHTRRSVSSSSFAPSRSETFRGFRGWGNPTWKSAGKDRKDNGIQLIERLAPLVCCHGGGVKDYWE